MFSSIIVLALGLATATNAQTQYTATGTAAVAAARATAPTLSPTSYVKGKTFDRFVTIWFENTDYSAAAAASTYQWIASQGITLTNYLAITHPSQPNYVAAVGGALNGVTGDTFTRIASSTRTIVDLLEAKGVSWGEYMEDMPYSGFEGNSYLSGSYVRKHNPLISYDSISSDVNRLAKTKNLTMFTTDLNNNKLPQWMFITPNIVHDGHDSSVSVSGAWAKAFLQPLLSNPNFLNNTLVLLTFDENSGSTPNKVFSVLLGDAVPVGSHGTTDATAYNHYSIMATVENNWSLGNLGLGDSTAAKFF